MTGDSPKWSILDQKWPDMAGLPTLQKGPKWTTYVFLTISDPFWAPLDPFGPFQTEMMMKFHENRMIVVPPPYRVVLFPVRIFFCFFLDHLFSTSPVINTLLDQARHSAKNFHFSYCHWIFMISCFDDDISSSHWLSWDVHTSITIFCNPDLE